ncbi:MAG TPA: hypothetical protein VJH55_03900 [Candidatus Paceibacterota bacterium]
MCVSARPAEFKGTTLYASFEQHPKLGQIAVNGYQNTARNLDRGPNAMLLHFPSRELVGKSNLVNTESAPRILEDMREALTPRSRGIMLSSPKRSSGGMAEVFDHDIYTIVSTHAPHLIPYALKMVPGHKRPTISSELLGFYEELFPDWAFLLCCFDNREAQKANPLLWWYRTDEERLFLPAIDSHTGYAPKKESVDVDHWVIFGTDLPQGVRVGYRDRISPELEAFLPERVIGRRFNAMLSNGDFVIENVLQATDTRSISRQTIEDYESLRVGALK